MDYFELEIKSLSLNSILSYINGFYCDENSLEERIERDSRYDLAIDIYKSAHPYICGNSHFKISGLEKTIKKSWIEDYYDDLKNYSVSSMFYNGKELFSTTPNHFFLKDFKTNKKAIYRSVILKNSRNYLSYNFDFEFKFIDFFNIKPSSSFFEYYLYEKCLVYYLAEIIEVKNINFWLHHHSNGYESNKEFIHYLEAIINHYKSKYSNLFPKSNLKQIKNWIKNTKEEYKSILEQFKITDEMSPYDTKNQTYPKLAITLENAPKVHLFIFLFYYRLNIEVPPIEQIATNMFILQGKKYIDTTTFDKILGAGYYYQKPNLREKHINSVLEYLTKSKNEELIPLFNNYVKEYFN